MTTPANGDAVIICSRCGKELKTDPWGRWVDRELLQTCGGDQPHVPAR